MNRNALPPSLVANLQQVLSSRKNVEKQQPPSESNNELTQSTEQLHQQQEIQEKQEEESPSSADIESISEETSSKPVILVTNGDGIESSGLICLVDALVREGRFDVYVCAPQLLV